MAILEWEIPPDDPGPIEGLPEDELDFPPDPAEFEAASDELVKANQETEQGIEQHDGTIRVTVTEQIRDLGRCFRDVIEAVRQIPEIIRADPDQDLLAIEEQLEEAAPQIAELEEVIALVPEPPPPPPPSECPQPPCPPPPDGGDLPTECPPGMIRLPSGECGFPLVD